MGGRKGGIWVGGVTKRGFWGQKGGEMGGGGKRGGAKGGFSGGGVTR